MRVKYLIIGAGITGCTAARLLQLHGEHDVMILEAESEPGGLCRTKKIGPHFLDIGGGHFLCTRFPEVSEFIFSHIPRSEFCEFDRVSKIAIDGEIIDYPIEFNLWQLSVGKRHKYLDSALGAGEVQGHSQPVEFEKWIRWKLGDEIAEHYMLPYNRKIWGVEPDEMDVDWLSKIPRVDAQTILETWRSEKSARDRFPSHEKFYYPLEGGFQRVFDAICASVRDKISLNHPVTRLERRDDVWRVNDAIDAEVVISTIPWATIHTAEGNDLSLEGDISKLRWSSLVVSLFEENYSHDWHWLYCPDENISHHREFFIHNFARHSAPGGTYRETNAKRWKAGKGEIYSHTNPIAYPIPLRGHAGAAMAVHEHYAARRLYGVGRWGQHSYFNSDVCIHEAMLLVKHLLS